MRETKAGRPHHVPLDDDALAFLHSITVGRPCGERLFLRANGAPSGVSHQLGPIAEASAAGGLVPPAPFHCRRHTWASQRVMAGAPLILAAQVLGHSDTRMVERHYGRLARGYVQQAIERTGMPLGDEPAIALPFRARR